MQRLSLAAEELQHDRRQHALEYAIGTSLNPIDHRERAVRGVVIYDGVPLGRLPAV